MAPSSKLFPGGMKFLLIFCLFLVWTSNVEGDPCANCDTPLPIDCTLTSVLTPPAEGGTPCSCVADSMPAGCVLKPCSITKEEDPCEITAESKNVPDRIMTYKFSCTGGDGGCETCKTLPADCDMAASITNPPAKGGPDCACNGTAIPGGCTLKPCHGGETGPCACANGVKSVTCFTGTCPSNRGGGSGGGSGGDVVAGGPGLISFPTNLFLAGVVGAAARIVIG